MAAHASLVLNIPNAHFNLFHPDWHPVTHWATTTTLACATSRSAAPSASCASPPTAAGSSTTPPSDGPVLSAVRCTPDSPRGSGGDDSGDDSDVRTQAPMPACIPFSPRLVRSASSYSSGPSGNDSGDNSDVHVVRAPAPYRRARRARSPSPTITHTHRRRSLFRPTASPSTSTERCAEPASPSEYHIS
jgi:hypothetical protein